MRPPITKADVEMLKLMTPTQQAAALKPATTKHRCPTTRPLEGSTVGCGSDNTSEPDEEGLVDCRECGIWFNPEEEKLPRPAPKTLGALEAAEITLRDLDDVVIPALDAMASTAHDLDRRAGLCRLRQGLVRLAHALAVQGPIRVALAGGPGSRWAASVGAHPDVKQ